MVEFNGTYFGKVIINGEKYGDVLVVKDQIIPRDRTLIEGKYKTTHLVAYEEIENLLDGDPEFVIIGSGQYGALKVNEKVVEKFEKNGVRALVFKTPQAIKEFNKLKKSGKKVNALIHVTC